MEAVALMGMVGDHNTGMGKMGRHTQHRQQHQGQLDMVTPG